MSYTYSAAEGSAKRTLVNGDTFGSAEGSDPVETMYIYVYMMAPDTSPRININKIHTLGGGRHGPQVQII